MNAVFCGQAGVRGLSGAGAAAVAIAISGGVNRLPKQLYNNRGRASLRHEWSNGGLTEDWREAALTVAAIAYYQSARLFAPPIT